MKEALTILLMVVTVLSANERIPRITSGIPVFWLHLPFLAKLLVHDRRICSGTLVRNRWILTVKDCVLDAEPSAIKVAVWGADYVRPPFRNVSEIFPQPCENHIRFKHLLTGQLFTVSPDSLVLLLLSEAVTGADSAFLDFRPLNDSALASRNQFLLLAGWGLVESSSPLQPYYTGTFFQTYQFNGSYQLPFILSEADRRGMATGDSGGATLLNTNGSVFQVGVIYKDIHVRDVGTYDLSIRLSSQSRFILGMIGWSDHEPWRWDAMLSDESPPLGTQELCRDDAGLAGTLLAESGKGWQCLASDSAGQLVKPAQFEVLTGTLFGYFSWKPATTGQINRAFTTQTLPGDIIPAEESGELPLEEPQVYCRIAVNEQYFTGHVYGDGCLILSGYEILVPD